MTDQNAHSRGRTGQCGIKKYHITEVAVREDIMAKAKELAELISTSDEVQTYRKAEKLVANHPEVQAIIKQIKKKQKEIVGFEYFKNEAMVKKIEAEIAELEKQLDQYPVVNQFKQTQEDINYLMQLVIGIVRDTVSEKIAVEEPAPVVTENCSD